MNTARRKYLVQRQSDNRLFRTKMRALDELIVAWAIQCSLIMTVVVTNGVTNDRQPEGLYCTLVNEDASCIEEMYNIGTAKQIYDITRMSPLSLERFITEIDVL